jgi:hypothetical protein
MIRKFIATLAAFSFLNFAHAAVFEITATDVGGTLTLTGAGSIDLTGIGLSGTLTTEENRSLVNLFGGLAPGIKDNYRPVINPFTPLSGSSTNPDIINFSISGDNFYVQSNGTANGFLILNQGYQSLDPISFVWTVTNSTTIDELNFGTITTFGNNTIELINGVPIPPAIWLFGTGLLGLIGMSRRKRAS